MVDMTLIRSLPIDFSIHDFL